ncbi:antibiotic biosynthesis monooxygenase family protein [Chloroflexota bacterium]
MFARVTLYEIDTLRISTGKALEQFKEAIVPAAKKQEGYEGLYVLGTSEGKGLIMSLWNSEDAAIAGVESGYYDEQIAKFLCVFRASPGRDHYEVLFADPPDIKQA